MKEEFEFNVGSLLKAGKNQFGVITSVDKVSDRYKILWTNSFQERGIFDTSTLMYMIVNKRWKPIWRNT